VGQTNDPEQIATDFAKWPDANVGYATGKGVFVLDADTLAAHGVDGIGNLEALQTIHGPLPATLEARTPTGGRHLYFKLPAGIEVKNSDGIVAPGVDVRGDGGYVLAPPSVKSEVGVYEWVNDLPIADAPPWLIEICKKKNKPRAAGQTVSPMTNLDLLVAALAVIPNENVGWDAWNTMGMAIYATTKGSEAGFAAFDTWSQKSTKYEASATAARWAALATCPPHSIGAGYVFALANQAKAGWRAPQWRETLPNGTPKPTMHNTRLAIAALGIECSMDTFHHKILFGYIGEDFKHKLLDGELCDDAIIMLRQKISDAFGFDPQEKPTWDAVKSLALEHCFDPVCDMLAEAETEWDGVARLDTMAVKYFNAEDTPFNRMAVRKMMIALPRRARQPGCKFDTILVLEGPEGWNKSSAFNKLVGDENFTDQRVIGATEKEVQEQLRGKWLQESAELDGMKKAEVNQVKGFASRRFDRARAAYDRAVTNQPRLCINVGTTKGDQYLQSQTGSRRWLPMKVLAPIDLEKLQRDRLQLFGEAATYETAGEPITLLESLWPDAALAQEARRVSDPWEDILVNMPAVLNLFNPELPGMELMQIIHTAGTDDNDFVSSAALLTHVLGIQNAQQTSAHTMRLATVMKKLGWEKRKSYINGQRVWGYARTAVASPPSPAPLNPDDVPM
jgi:hypothetical protein